MHTSVESEIGSAGTEKAFPGSLCRHTYSKLYRQTLPWIEGGREREGDDDENNIESGKKVGVFIKEKLCEM